MVYDVDSGQNYFFVLVFLVGVYGDFLFNMVMGVWFYIFDVFKLDVFVVGQYVMDIFVVIFVDGIVM